MGLKRSQRSMEIWLDFEENVVDGHFVFVWPVAADVGPEVGTI